MPTKNTYAKLPKAFKARWVENLKSGKYKKAKNYLHTDKGFCCLGVAYDCSPWVPKKEKWFVSRCDDFGPKGNVYRPNSDYDAGDEEGLLALFHVVPPTIRTVLQQDINHVLPEYGGLATTVEEYLIHLNDKKNLSFKLIAKWIDKHL